MGGRKVPRGALVMPTAASITQRLFMCSTHMLSNKNQQPAAAAAPSPKDILGPPSPSPSLTFIWGKCG